MPTNKGEASRSRIERVTILPLFKKKKKIYFLIGLRDASFICLPRIRLFTMTKKTFIITTSVSPLRVWFRFSRSVYERKFSTTNCALLNYYYRIGITRTAGKDCVNFVLLEGINGYTNTGQRIYNSIINHGRLLTKRSCRGFELKLE